MAAPRLRPLPPRGAQRLASWEAELSQGAPRGISRERHAETLDEPRAFDEERPAASQAAAPRLSPRGAPAQYAPFSASERSGLEVCMALRLFRVQEGSDTRAAGAPAAGEAVPAA